MGPISDRGWWVYERFNLLLGKESEKGSEKASDELQAIAAEIASCLASISTVLEMTNAS